MISTNIFNHLGKDSIGSFKHNKIAVRGNEIFYGINSSIRYAKSDEDYRLLDTDIDFEIRNIKLNSSNNLLAVYNENNLIVLSVGTGITRQYKIGSKLFKNVSIKSLLWNKLARNDSNLIILSDDNVIRSFDLNFSFEEPKKVFGLTNKADNKKGLISNSIDDPVAITFGTTGTKLSSLLSLYVVNKDGDIFTIYPFLPVDEISATREQVEELFNDSVLLLNQAIEGEKDVDKGLSIKQLRFVNSIWKQLPLAPVEIRDFNKSFFISSLEDTTHEDSYSIQGPFALQPFPECLYDDEATDIVSVQSDKLDLLVVSFLKYGFTTLLPDYRLSMKWEDFFTDSSSVSAVSVLTVLDHAKPKSQGQTTINVLEKSSLLMENDSNLYKVNLSPEGKSVSSTELLLKNFQDYEGHGVIYDYEKNTRYQIILSNSKLDVQKEAIDTSKHLKKDDDKVDVEIPYHSVLNLSITSELLILLDKIKNFKIYLPPNLSVLSKLDEDSLSELNSITNSISKNLLNFHKSGIIVNYKLNNLSAEFQNQITVTSEIFEKYRKLSGINNSLEKVIERQESLNKRFDSLKKNIHTSSKSFDLTLSTKEKQWFKEISLMVKNFNQSLKKNQSLNEQLKFIRKELTNVSTISGKNSDDYDWEELNSILVQGKRLLDSTQNSLSTNLKDLDTQLGALKV